MSDFIERLKVEHSDLLDKSVKLKSFLHSKPEDEVIAIVGLVQYKLLMEQLYHMYEYLNILTKRLDDLENNSNRETVAST